MTMESKEIRRVLSAHDEYVNRQLPMWRGHKAAYEGRFWEEYAAQYGMERPQRAKVEINLVLPYVASFVASLFYKGLHTKVTWGGVGGKVGRPFDPGPVAVVCDRWLKMQPLISIFKQAVKAGMLYGEAGLFFGVRSGIDPENGVWVDFMPPWECVWDRKARSLTDMRYRGRVMLMAKEDVASLYNISESGLIAGARTDVIKEGPAKRTTSAYDDQSYVRVLHFFDWTAEYKVGKDRAVGEYTIWLLDQTGGREVDDSGMRFVERMPFPYQDADGEPLDPIEPVILEPVPEFPLQGLAPVRTLFELNRELNLTRTFMAQAFRKDVARILLVLKDRVDSDTLEAIERGDDWAMAQLEGETLEIAKWLDQQPVHPTLLQYVAMLQQDRQETGTTSPLTRGEPLKYATASEVMAHQGYTETTVGLLRSETDDAMIRVIGKYLHVLRAAMQDAKVDELSVRYRGNTVKVSREALAAWWEITLMDKANNPMAEAQEQATMKELGPALMELIQVASAPDDPTLEGYQPVEVRYHARLQYDHFVRLHNLPEEWLWENMERACAAKRQEEEGVLEARKQEEAALAQAQAAPPQVPMEPAPAPVGPAPGEVPLPPGLGSALAAST